MSRSTFNSVVLVLLLLGSGGSTTAVALEPSISSVQAQSSSLVITGANFGSKASAKPFFYQNYTTSNGVMDADLQLGYANQRQYSSNAYGSYTTVDMSLGRTPGRGVLKLNLAAGAADYFPHVSVNASNTGRGTLSSQNTDELYISYWIKLELVSGTPASGVIQIKSSRSGSGGATSNYYSVYPLYVSSLYPKGDLTGFIGLYQEARDTSGVTSGGEHYDATGASSWISGGWNFVEIWQKYNTPGVANGFLKYKINGVFFDKDIGAESSSAILVRKNGEGAYHFDFSMLVPGVDVPGHTATSQYRLLFSEHYIDTTPQRVMIGNAATLATNKAGLLCLPSSWGNNSVTVDVSNIPEGYKWIYVTNSAGETNANGFPLSNVGVQPAPPKDLKIG